MLRDVGLEVAAGETVALMGASGSGKSILARAVVGLVKPDGGQVWLDGEEVTGSGAARLREIRRKVGMLFQQNALFDSMTVKENIGFVLREVMGLSDAEIGARVTELLERLHLGPIVRMYPSELSGGMKKRVGIARAVAHEPRIVIYDDPTAGLDPITSEAIGELIAELGQRTDRAVLMVSNYLPLIMATADRVLLLHQGRIIRLGAPADIFTSERTELREFLDSNGEG